MLSNYLSNAVKFTAPITGQITVFVTCVPSTVARGRVRLRWTVRDNGIGLQEHELPLLFQSYQQASASVARQHGGTGLGLTIVRELADLMRGAAPPGTSVGETRCELS
jgi:signal transduction histidine kinase